MKDIEAEYTLICDKCGNVFYSSDGFLDPQLCPKCRELISDEEIKKALAPILGYDPDSIDLIGIEREVAKAQHAKDKAEYEQKVKEIFEWIQSQLILTPFKDAGDGQHYRAHITISEWQDLKAKYLDRKEGEDGANTNDT